MQEKLVLLGATQIFHEVPMLIDSLLGITVSESQVYRTVQMVSQLMEDSGVPSEDLQQIYNQPDEQVYGMIDGSFLFTDDGWKEVKVGRVFKADGSESEPFKWEMGQSEYVAQRGHYQPFTERFECLLPQKSLCKKVFITDGAHWITNWLAESYPESLQILDFYHVCEKLASVPKLTVCKKGWFEKYKAHLLAGEVTLICKSIKKLDSFSGQEELVNYLEKNSFRMHYNEYREKGLMIASGPIESAHRTVLQSRMKRSGQRWSDQGCDTMVKLRVAYKSGKASLITNTLLKQAA